MNKAGSPSLLPSFAVEEHDVDAVVDDRVDEPKLFTHRIDGVDAGCPYELHPLPAESNHLVDVHLVKPILRQLVIAHCMNPFFVLRSGDGPVKRRHKALVVKHLLELILRDDEEVGLQAEPDVI